MDKPFTRRVFLSVLGLATTVRGNLVGDVLVPEDLDHVILGARDLDQGIDFVLKSTGIRPAFGGVHPGRGTRNALLGLGTGRYLEIIAPDPEQHGRSARSLEEIEQPRLVGWAVHTRDIDAVARRLQRAGVAYEGPTSGSRLRPGGVLLKWKTLNLKDDRAGLLPFFIEWSQDSIHPSVDAPRGCLLKTVSWTSADPTELRKTFSALGMEVGLGQGPERFQVEVEGPGGRFRAASR